MKWNIGSVKLYFLSRQRYCSCKHVKETGQSWLTQPVVQLITDKMTNRSGSAIRVTEHYTSRDWQRQRELDGDYVLVNILYDFTWWSMTEIRRRNICGVNCVYLPLKHMASVITRAIFTVLWHECYLAISCKCDDYNYIILWWVPWQQPQKHSSCAMWIVKYYLQAAAKQTADD